MDITVRVRLINNKNEVLLVFEGGQKVFKGDGASFIKPYGCGLPGGRKKPHETPREAAIRELYEETGFDADLGNEPTNIFVDREHEVYLYDACNPRGEPRVMDERIIAIRWVDRRLIYGIFYIGKDEFPVYKSHMPLIHHI